MVFVQKTCAVVILDLICINIVEPYSSGESCGKTRKALYISTQSVLGAEPVGNGRALKGKNGKCTLLGCARRWYVCRLGTEVVLAGPVLDREQCSNIRGVPLFLS